MGHTFTYNRANLYSRALFLCLAICVFSARVQAQITVASNKTAAELAAALTGTGVIVLAPTLTCHGAANGIYTTGSVDPLGGIPAGIVLTTGTAKDTLGNNGISHPASTFESSSYGTPGDAALATVAGTTTSNTHDACILEFNFKAAGDTVSFNYVFASEEYPEFACSGFNDVFAFLISGGAYSTPTNIALIPGTTIPVCINSVNSAPIGTSYPLSTCTSMGAGCPYTMYYVNNSASTLLVFDGMTTVFPAIAAVSPCDTYHLKLGVADVGDAAYNSAVFIQGGSLTSIVPTTVSAVGTSGLPYCVRGCAPGDFIFSTPTPQDTPVTIYYNITGTAVNGYDYATIASSVVIPAFASSAAVVINPLMVPPVGPKVVTLQILIPDPCFADSFTVGGSASLTILDSFAFRIITPDTSICRGESMTITAEGDAMFSTILTYTWGPAASLSTTGILTPVIATPTVTTTYTLTGSTSAAVGCVPQMREVTITVYEPPTLSVDSHLVRTCVGVPVMLHATIPGTTIPMTYTWTPPTHLSSTTIWNPIVNPTVAGDITYTVSVHPTANIYCVSVDTIRVHTLPNDFTLHNPDTAICLGSAVQTRITGSNEFLWQWAPPTWVSNVNVKTPVITPGMIGTYGYTVTASYAHCPDMIHSFTIEVDTAAHPVSITDTICLGMVDTFDFTVPGTVGGTGSNYYHYQWLPGTYVSNDTMPNVVITPTVAGSLTYTITVSPHAAACAVNNIVNLEVLPNKISVYPEDTAICVGESIQVTATGYHPSFTYQWLPTAGIAMSHLLAPLVVPDTSATYVVTGHFHKCPDIRDTMIVDVQPNPDVYLGGNRFVCEFDTLHIHASVTPSWYTNYTYSWTPGTTLDFTTGSSVTFYGKDTATVIATVTTANGRCTSIDSAQIIVYPGNFASLDTQARDFCPHDSATIRPQGGVAYSWTPTLYLDDPNAINPVIKPITSETYTIIATSQHGCRDTIGFQSIVHPGAVLYLGDSATIYPGESYQIKNQTNCSAFTWFPPAGLSNAYIADPIATPLFNTKYVVNGVTEWGCEATDSINIYVSTESLLALPNAFTPGSGVNNEFKIIKRGIATLNYFRIFNRWGNLVFETTDIDKGWDGQYNGVPQPFGVFVYQVEAVTSTGRIFEKHGNVTLIR
ncbi:MAG: choice-of-anchor L domain-containing protein [Bacteroidota bacterium]